MGTSGASTASPRAPEGLAAPGDRGNRNGAVTGTRRRRAFPGSRFLVRAFWIVVPLAAFFGLWEAYVDAGFADPLLLPPPSDIFPAVWNYFADGTIFPHLVASMRRGATGFVIATLIAIPLGLLIGSVGVISRALSPLIEFLRQLPALAMLPVFVLLLGIGFRAQVAIVIWAAVWPILLNTVTGAREVDVRLVKAARTLGANRLAVFAKVVLPSALPTIMTGLRLGASYAFLVLIAAEMVGANTGLGFLVLTNQYSFHTKQMFAAILILAAIGFALNYALLAFERIVTPWRQYS
jgi:NitT/TauT family transport system permease protein